MATNRWVIMAADMVRAVMALPEEVVATAALLTVARAVPVAEVLWVVVMAAIMVPEVTAEAVLLVAAGTAIITGTMSMAWAATAAGAEWAEANRRRVVTAPRPIMAAPILVLAVTAEAAPEVAAMAVPTALAPEAGVATWADPIVQATAHRAITVAAQAALVVVAPARMAAPPTTTIITN